MKKETYTYPHSSFLSIEKDMNINVTEGTALDLSCYEDNTFDMTLVL